MALDIVFKKVNILKNIYWFILFLGIAFGMFFMIITPTIKDYKVKNLDLKDSMENVITHQKEYEQYAKELSKIKVENKNILISFQNKYREDKVLEYISSYFKQISIVNKKIDKSDPEFIKYEFIVKGVIDSPDKFYNLAEALNKSSNVIEIDFPIEFSTDRKGIINNLVIRVFELKDKNKKF
jgi:hypothetical protein